MPSVQISASRRGGTCGVEYAHDIRIRPGQRTLTTTYFKSDEHCRDFGVEPLSRHRVCITCTASKLTSLHRAGTLHTIAGLTAEDLVSLGIVAPEEAEAIAADWAAVADDQRASLGDFAR